METLAAFLGTVIGKALQHCAPVLFDIVKVAVREAITDTMEDGKADPALLARLKDGLKGKT